MGMSWYSIANEEVNLTIQEVMKENHGDLHAEGVTITALIATSNCCCDVFGCRWKWHVTLRLSKHDWCGRNDFSRSLNRWGFL